VSSGGRSLWRGRRCWAAAERAADAQHGGWLLRDLWLRASLLKEVGPAPDVPLLEPGPVLDRALDAMPMDRHTAAVLAPRWRELDRAHMLSLRMVRRLLGPRAPWHRSSRTTRGAASSRHGTGSPTGCRSAATGQDKS
jgi:hypothetical protein